MNPIFHRLFSSKSSNTSIQMLRFALTGGFVTALDFVLLYVLTEYVGMYYLYSAAVSFWISMTINYGLAVRWIFPERKFKSKWVEYSLFIITGLGGLAINEFFIWYITEELNVYYMYSKIFPLIVLFLYSFFVRKYLLFRV